MTVIKDELVIVGTGIESALWCLQDTRKRTLEALKDLPDDALGWHIDGHPNSISTLLYHIAAIEADWLFDEVLGGGFEKVEGVFPYNVRDKEGQLTVIENMSLSEHLERFSVVRQHVLEAYQTMDEAQYRQKREMPNYFVTPEWVLYHLYQHELAHLGEIKTIRGMYEAKHFQE